METASTSGRGCVSHWNPSRPGWFRQPSRKSRLQTQGAVEIGKLNREPVPVPKGYTPQVVPGAKTKPTPLLGVGQVVQRLQNSLTSYGAEYFGAFYSSQLGGIVTDPSLVLMPLDDQFVCKGHGVVETIILRDGHLYMMNEHIDRLEAVCDYVGLKLPFSQPAVKRIILDTAAASGKMNGQLRIWITPGRGGFSPVQMGGTEPTMYVLCLADTYDIDRTVAWDAIVWPEPIWPNHVSIVHSNQHLLTTVAQLKAHVEGANVAIFTDEEGFVQQCAGYAICILTNTDILVYPPFINVPPSLTLERILDMIPEERERSPNDVVVADVVERRLHISEVKAAKEAFVVCTPYTVAPIRSVDQEPIADNGTGVTTLALHYMLDNDMAPPPPGVFSERHTPVPYGYPSGMRSQLA